MSVVRSARKSDVGQIVQLSMAVQKIHSDQHPDIFKELVNTDELADFYVALINDKDQYLFVTELGESITGYCWAEFMQKIESTITHSIKKLYIHQMCVDKRWRGQGLGNILVQEIKSLANSLNVNHVGVDSWSFNSRAAMFFRSQGFTSQNEKMWLK